MTKNPLENRQIIEFRANLRQLQTAADHLATLQYDLTCDLEQALLRVLELPQDDEDVSQIPRETFVIPEAETDAKPFHESSRINNLRQQLLNGQRLAEDLLRQQDRLKSALQLALQEALELHHAEVEARNELGGEG